MPLITKLLYVVAGICAFVFLATASVVIDALMGGVTHIVADADFGITVISFSACLLSLVLGYALNRHYLDRTAEPLELPPARIERKETTMTTSIFRAMVIACLVLIAYGVMYRNLPCWAQLFDRTLYCQMVEAGKRYQPVNLGKDLQDSFDRSLKSLRESRKRETKP